jgi:hypothetical protein
MGETSSMHRSDEQSVYDMSLKIRSENIALKGLNIDENIRLK